MQERLASTQKIHMDYSGIRPNLVGSVSSGVRDDNWGLPPRERLRKTLVTCNYVLNCFDILYFPHVDLGDMGYPYQNGRQGCDAHSISRLRDLLLQRPGNVAHDFALEKDALVPFDPIRVRVTAEYLRHFQNEICDDVIKKNIRDSNTVKCKPGMTLLTIMGRLFGQS